MFKGRIVDAIKEATQEKNIYVEYPEIEGHGDYSSNIAMQIATRAKERESERVKGKNSKEIAEEIAKKLQENEGLTRIVEKIEVAEPGFINFWIKKEVLMKEAGRVTDEGERHGSSDLGKGKTILVEYSSPNIAKYFGIGHLRSTVIGQALYNIYKFLGYKVIGDNHLGDWGTQFGMIIAQVVRKKLDPTKLSIKDYESLYVKFNKEADKKPKLLDEAREWFQKLEKGDKTARDVWKKAVDTSSKEFNRIYKKLGVGIDSTFGESFYEDKVPSVVEEVRKKGLSKKSEGAEIVELPSTNSEQALPPAMLLKSDGATTYYTRDLATVKYRIDKWRPDFIIYEVGADQILHFKQVFRTSMMMNWNEDTDLVHVAHGLIRFKHGKMSTRKGKTVKLEEVLDEAVGRAKKIIEKSETSRGLSKSEKEKVATAVGIGAIKYFDLSHHYSSDIIFDWEKMFLLEGNSAPYLQYTFARTQSVLAKSKRVKEWESKSDLRVNEEEMMLLRSFPRFSEIICDAAKNYSPNLLCNYLFDLAQKYNAFYNKHRILDVKSKRAGERESVREFRVVLTAATGQILKNGLELLGIGAPEKI